MTLSSISNLTTIHQKNTCLYQQQVALIVSALIIIVGVGILLATAQLLPQKLNSIQIWGYFAGAGLIAGGMLTLLITQILHCRTASKKNTAEQPNRFSSPTTNIEKALIEKFFYYRTTTPDKFKKIATHVSFFYYNCDEIQDKGWGCAWRCMQMCASAFNQFPSFQELYSTYHLEAHKTDEWAEPGYCKRYLDDHGIPSQLFLYNKKAGTRKTPTEWCEKITGFSILKSKLHEHFMHYNTPIMIDNIEYTFSILGIRITHDDQTILFIADPHKFNAESGLYFVVLDKNGKRIATTGIDDGINGYNSVQHLHFDTQGWILLFPRPTCP